MAEMSEDERIVRDAWREVSYCEQSPYMAPIIFIAPFDGMCRRRFSGASKTEAWSAARKFTDDVQEEVRQLEEEVDVIKKILECYVSHGGGTWRRILARLESALTEAKKGMTA